MFAAIDIIPDEIADLDNGPPKGRSDGARSALQRQCALTRKPMTSDDMIRFVVAPAGVVVADVKKKLPGRGLWLEARGTCVRDAVKKGVFARSFKRAVNVPSDLAETTQALLAQAALDALAMAGKAGEVVCGFTKVEKVLHDGAATALLHAADGSADGIRKLASVLRAENATQLPVIRDFASDQLDLALGRPNVIHAALLAGPAGKTFLARARRLARFRGDGEEAIAANATIHLSNDGTTNG